MNIYRININLLKVFSVLMQEQHVSAAANRLHLTQPAISNSLQQLRELFQDELLIRGPKRMIPTQKALFLAPKVDQALNELETLLFHSDEFEYKTSTRTFKLGMTNYAEYVLLGKIYEQIRKSAPKVSLKILHHNEFCAEDFEKEKLDIGIGLAKKFPRQLQAEKLFMDQPVCVARANHAIFKKPLTLERYLQAEHLAACVYSEELPRADQALRKLNLQRNIKLSLPNALPALEILASSDLVGTFSRNIILQSAKKYQLKFAPPPFFIAPFPIVQVWHRQQDNDAGLVWLRGEIRRVCDRCFSGSEKLFG